MMDPSPLPLRMFSFSGQEQRDLINVHRMKEQLSKKKKKKKKKIYCMSQTDGSNIERLREMVHKDLLITITGDDAAVLIDLMYSLEANNKPHTISVIIVAVFWTFGSNERSSLVGVDQILLSIMDECTDVVDFLFRSPRINEAQQQRDSYVELVIDMVSRL